MEKDYKDAISKSKESMYELESNVESVSGDFTKTTTDIWGSLKSNFSDISTKLQEASENFSKAGDEATLQAHLGAMEARDKVESIKSDVEEFTKKVANDAKVSFDEVTLQAYLGKMEAEDFWEKRGPDIKEDFKESAANVEKLAVEAINEIGGFFSKLATEFKENKKV